MNCCRGRWRWCSKAVTAVISEMELLVIANSIAPTPQHWSPEMPPTGSAARSLGRDGRRMIGLGSFLITAMLNFSTEQCALARDGTLERGSSPRVQMLANDVIEECGCVGL